MRARGANNNNHCVDRQGLILARASSPMTVVGHLPSRATNRPCLTGTKSNDVLAAWAVLCN